MYVGVWCVVCVYTCAFLHVGKYLCECVPLLPFVQLCAHVSYEDVCVQTANSPL